MTIFNPDNKENLSTGECLKPAMTILSVNDAAQYFESYVEYIQKTMDILKEQEGKNYVNPNKTAEKIAKDNLAYYAGYYNEETRQRVERLFKCQHPLFGSIKEQGPPSNQEAFQCGKENKTLLEIRSTRKVFSEKI